MKKYSNTLQSILTLIFFMHLPVYAADTDVPHVFQIKAWNCSLCPEGEENMTQTGFIVKGQAIKGKSGIITALHGVVGRDSIDAVGVGKEKDFSKLKIIAVDIKHDMAFLSSDNLQQRKDGLNPPGQQTRYTGIRCTGYSSGIRGQDTKKNLRFQRIERLEDRLNSKLRMMLKERKSPNIDIDILSIEGQIVPGLSGAPILNDSDEVVGVADGTVVLGGGTSWAIPFDQIDWKDASDQQMVAEMKRLEPLSISVLSSLAVQISRSKTLMLQQLRSGEMMDWYAAQEYAEKMNRESLEGYSDWRVPAKGELQKIAQLIKKVPNSYTDTNELYWSSEGIVSQARAVHLGSGQEEIESKRSKFSVWLVRNFD
ncbi:MAG: DUF1566 domain-containing protein [Candidatus Electrothrix sp. AUS3]|nr:DUF1566 domain-containing protein [Candidatus Electrothrix gigas]